jgi:GLPGLI family protein
MGHCYKKYKFLFFLVSGIVFTGLFLTMPACNTVLTKDSGSIDYEISYADSMKKDIMASMLPSKMNFKFIPGTTLNEFKVGMGIITATFIANEETKTLTSLFKVIDKKYALIYSPEETKAELDKLPKFKIVLSGESKKIAGYTCKKAILSQVGKEGNTFAVFYTTEIKVKNPNWNLPYAEIHGVLME